MKGELKMKTKTNIKDLIGAILFGIVIVTIFIIGV